MKKTVLMRLLSLVLALVMLGAASAVPVYAQSGKCGCGTPPVIYVAALGSATLYLDKGTENERVLFRPETETYVQLALRLAPAIARLAVDKNYDAFGDSLIAGVDWVFGDLQMDENGDSTDRVTTDRELPTDPDHGVDKSYYFGYDFREDPLTVADKLHEYIEHVKELTGHDTVLLRASSMGGVMTMAYFYKYGTHGIDACIFQCCPIQGTAVAGELFTKQMEINPEALVRYASQLPLDEEWQESLLNVVLMMLYKAGVIDALVGVADNLLDNLMDRVFEEFMYPVFGSMPGIWSFVPDCDYEKAKEMAFDGNTSEKLISRLDEYHYNVQCRAGEILNKAKADGVKIMIVAGYNMQRTPLVKSYMNNSDATVDTCYASVGGTVALLGETLGEGYVQKNEAGVHDHLSKDGVVDASTCLMPENTWFVRDMLHSKIHSGHKAMYNWFFYTDGELDIWSNEDYPQFLQNDKVNEKLLPLGEQKRPAVNEITSETDAAQDETLTPQTGENAPAALLLVSLISLAAVTVTARRKKCEVTE